MVSAARQPDQLLGLMESLGDPVRLRLLRLLERRELGVAELTDVLQLPQSTVSRHLKLLSDQGWIQSRSERTANLYSMAELDAAARRLWQLTREQTEDWPALAQDRLRLARRLEDRSRAAQRFFAGAAAGWDEIRAELYGVRFVQSALAALLPRDWVVADLGCGTGLLEAELAPHVGQVIGVDQSAAMLKAARRRTSAFGNVRLEQGGLEALPLENASCDAVLMILSLTYVHDVPRSLCEAARVLRPGGRAVVVDLLRHDREDFRRRMGQRRLGFETAELTALLADAGFGEARARELTPEPDVKGPALLLATGVRGAEEPSPAQRPRPGGPVAAQGGAAGANRKKP
jgi:ArsR family transcriptional regulator